MSTKLKTIPLSQLKPSRINARKTDKGADIEQLAASIAANGLLENLVVQPSANGDDETFEVVAGGRRLTALKLLAKRRKLDRDHRVPCLVVLESAAAEASLAENFVRMPLHPADQCDAFSTLHKQGQTADEIASRFGIQVQFVLQRLKLAAVSPKLLSEYRQGAMTLDQLTAFTLSDDHVAQERIWFERQEGELPAYLIRRLLTSAQVPANDRRARFVGAAAYEAAGGTILRDLFDAEDGGYFTDSVLLDRLVSEKLSGAAAQVLAEGWHWVEVHADLAGLDLPRLGRARRVERELSEKEEKRLSKLGARYDELVSKLGEDEENAELDRVSREIERLQEKKEGWAPEDLARAGAIVTLGPDGQPEAIRGLIKPETTGKTAPEKSDRPKRANGYSDAILLDLSAHRTAALREVLAGQPETALTALLHALLGKLFYDRSYASCISLMVQAVDLERCSQTVGDSKAELAFRARQKSWSERLPDPESCWTWLAGLHAEDRLSLLAYCVAMTVNALGNHLGPDAETVDQLVRATDLDMREWWRPTEANFLGRLTKAEIAAAVTEGVSEQASWRISDFKKDRMAKEAEKLLADGGWLPAPLRVLGEDTSDISNAA